MWDLSLAVWTQLEKPMSSLHTDIFSWGITLVANVGQPGFHLCWNLINLNAREDVRIRIVISCFMIFKAFKRLSHLLHLEGVDELMEKWNAINEKKESVLLKTRTDRNFLLECFALWRSWSTRKKCSYGLWHLGEAQLGHHWAPIPTSTTLMLPRAPFLSTWGSEILTMRWN